jgi:hypothetical protein
VFFLRGGAGAVQSSPPPVAVAQVAPPPVAPSAPPPVAPTVAPQPAQVSVQVESDPLGAAVSVDGKEVCSGTPCNFSAERGKEVTVQVEKSGYKPASTKLTPVTESSQITLTLRKRESSHGGHGGGTRQVGDLKIPDAFGPR